MNLRIYSIILALLCMVRFLHWASAVDDLEDNTLPRILEKGEEGYFFEGDIRQQPGDSKDPYDILHRSRHDRQAKQFGEGGSGDTPMDEFIYPRRWLSNRIPYKFKSGLSTTFKETFGEAIREWNSETCIVFAPATENDTDYLLLTDQKGCSSYVGRIGGEQEVSLSSGCNDKGHAIHLLGHALGFWHEHSRPDRDSYIRIIWKNIIEEKLMNFGILSQAEFEYAGDVGYDIESIMHYGPYAFSIHPNESVTIQRLDAPEILLDDCTLDMGQRIRLSYLDKLRANYLYQCTDKIRELKKTGREGDCGITPPPPPVKPSKTIVTGTRITIQFEEPTNGDPLVAIACENSTLGCIKQECIFFESEYTCAESQKFDIFFTKERKNCRIKSGYTIVMRSVYTPTQWIDCNMGQCTISECAANEGNPNILCSISDCSKHFLNVYAIGKSDGKAIRTSDKMVFKHPNNTMFLNCEDRNCKLVNDPDCLTRSSSEPTTGTELLCQRFSLQKE